MCRWKGQFEDLGRVVVVEGGAVETSRCFLSIFSDWASGTLWKNVQEVLRNHV